jgi:very-short-patch-repair endonuclease
LIIIGIKVKRKSQLARAGLNCVGCNITTNSNMSSVTNDNRIEVAIERLREDLLDLTRRNSLINASITKGKKHITIVDELPSQIYAHLLDQNEFGFDCIPDPSEEEIEGWREDRSLDDGTPSYKEVAKWHNIIVDPNLANASRDGVGGRHEDDSLQTPYFGKELEARLATIKRAADSMIQETGMNMLHLTIGYLEWFETEDTSKPCLSPLFSIPVTLVKGSLDRQTKTYKYGLKWSGEDLVTNASLAKRLERDFGFSLPEITTGEQGGVMEVEDYLEAVHESVKEIFPTWSVQRRGVISFLNFSKLLLYNDLNTQKWPNLLNHKIVKAAIIGSNNDGSRSDNYLEDRELDKLTGIEKSYPLVTSADSSQHSAIIDALQGESMVIEGPPGTGKSQTITNLIAAFLSQGKTVLFVSEKMAALSVVKDRMTNLGMDDFILELHSHATQKLGVMEAFDKRIKRRRQRDLGDLDEEIEKITSLREKLNRHSLLMNTEWKGTGRTIFEIFAATIKEKKSIDGELLSAAESVYLDCCKTPLEREELYRKADSLLRVSKTQLVACEDGDIVTHPWYGINATNLTGADKSQVIAALAAWRMSLAELREGLQSLADLGRIDTELQPSHGQSMVQLADKLPPIDSNMLRLLGWSLNDDGNMSRLSEFNTLADELKQLMHSSVYEITADNLLDIKRFDCSEVLRLADKAQINKSLKLHQLTEIDVILDSVKQSSEVLKSRMAELNDFCSTALPDVLNAKNLSAASIENFISSYEWLLNLREAINYRHPSLLSDEGLNKLRSIKENLSNLLTFENSIEDAYQLDDVPPEAELDIHVRILADTNLIGKIFSKDYRQAKSHLKSLYKKDKKTFNELPLLDHIHELKRYAALKTTYEESCSKLENTAITFTESKDCCPKLIESIIEWHSQLKDNYTAEPAGIFSGFDLNSLGTWIMTAKKEELLALERLSEYGFKDDLKALQQHYIRLNHFYLPTAPPVEDSTQLTQLEELGALEDLRSFSSELEHTQQHSLFQENFTLSLWINEAEKVNLAKDKLVSLREEIQSLVSDLDLVGYSSNTFDIQKLCGSAENAEVLLMALAECESPVPQIFKAVLSNNCEPERFARYSQWAQSYRASIQRADYAKAKFVEQVDLNDQHWNCNRASGLEGAIMRCDKALEKEDEFSTYVLFTKSSAELRKLLSRNLIACITSGKYSPQSIRSAVRLGIMQAYSADILNSTPALNTFQGADHESYVNKFNEATEALDILQRKRIISKIERKSVPRGEAGYRVSEHTELHLIKHECNKQRRHIPIRQLLRRSPLAAQALKPCFMMGPRSVAQYLTPGSLEFDVLLIDEASQLKPEEALGACARASQVIVVGDSKQLPPTSFFDSTTNDDEDEDAISMDDQESILDALKGAAFPARILRWHYRSKHESLIAFSNLKFYNNELNLFPSPERKSSAYGITYRYIEQGLFENQQNKPEAWAVAERVKRLISKNPKLSVGVATMSSKQAQLVESYIDQLAKNDPQFDRALTDNRATREPLFIKNLETVQGDERDTIIISCTYGRGSHGPTPQRFGPINNEMGWRRLNVLFTRSRERMEIFASMHHGDVRPTAQSSRGVIELKAFLHYAETGHLEHPEITERPADSDFEVSVAEILRDHGYECDYQVGVSGFFIDLAVRHPKCPDRHIMAIECDGATYHSGKSARDRDFLRQSILESLGWRIRRIWSTDWFNNHNQCIAPIIDELNSLSNAPIVEEVNTVWGSEPVSTEVQDIDESPTDEELELFSHTYADNEVEEDLGGGVKIEVYDKISLKFEGDDDVIYHKITYGPSVPQRDTLGSESPLGQFLVDRVVSIENPEPLIFNDRTFWVLTIEKSDQNTDD